MAGKKLTCLECGQINRLPVDRLKQGGKCGVCGAGLISDKAVDVSPDTLAKAVRNDDLPLVVDFWAPWCGPCRAMAPEFTKAAQGLRGEARLVKLNTEDHQKAGARHRIRGIPTMIAFDRGRESKRQSGMVRADQIMTWVRA